jgi:hypothetical protein
MPDASPRRAEPDAQIVPESNDQSSGYPGRPTALDPQQLGFTPRRAVPWLSPVLLAGTALRVVLAELFGAYLDKRELQSALPGPIFDERPTDPDGRPDDVGEVWLDYVADLGDGFDATYTIAYLLAQRRLDVEGLSLPRARVLVMGGDQVYPTASGQQYEDRFKGPYRAALPEPPADGRPPTLYALPGNHDWYDGLTAFLRLFARAQHGKVGGWRTVQSRSYFAMRLPNRWWLFGIDAQFGAYLDDPQLQYFHDASQQVAPGDRVILCTPAPTWVEAVDNRHAYDTVDYFVRTVLAPRRAQVRLMLSGDLHHYARYSGPDRELITAGGGGAYLYPTHHLPERIEVPPASSLVRHASPSRWYRLAASYPTRRRSAAFAAGVFARLPWRNPSFVALLGTLHMLLMLAMANAAQQISGTEQRLVTIPLALTVIVVLGSAVAFAMPPTAGRRRPRHWVLGSAHGVVHIGLALLGTYLWLRSPFFDLSWPWPLVLAAVLYLPLSGLAASQLLSAYLLVASAFDVNVNELFAAQGIADAKSFVRLHLAPDGTLTIYPVAVDRVGRTWTATPDAAPDKPWFEPRKRLAVRLAEPPIVIR